MPKHDAKPSSRLDHIFSYVIPPRFLLSEYAFHAKVLLTFAVTVGGLAITILIGLTFHEGTVPIRRLMTVFLASLLLAAVLLVRWVPRIEILAWYVISLSLAIVWYVDFNNVSVVGPNTVLWIVPFSLTALVLKGRQLLFMLTFIAGLFVTNVSLLFSDRLPSPIVNPMLWSKLEAVYLLCAGVVVVVCTSGVARLAREHMVQLQDELKQKQERIQEINELKIKAEASTESKSMFLATMSHELRTPLNSVIGNAQLLAKAELPDKLTLRVNDISVAGNLLLFLINDILDFSQLEHDELKLVNEPYNLSAQISDLCRMMESRLHQNVKLSIVLPDNQVVVNADQHRMAQILMNLLSNAIKFTLKGFIKISLKVDNTSDVVLFFEDTGIGMTNQAMAELFKPFSQVSGKSSINVGGTGLGLAIAKGITDKYNGSITVKSEIQKGTTFTLQIPNIVCAVSEIEQWKAQSETGHLRIEEVLQDKSILVVDDIEMNCILLEDMLLTLGVSHVFIMNSGEGAIEFIQQHPETHLVLMDVRMPLMSGIEATIKLRQTDYHGCVIAVTANATLADREACLQAGMDDFISKPISLEELRSVLERIFSAPANR